MNLSGLAGEIQDMAHQVKNLEDELDAARDQIATLEAEAAERELKQEELYDQIDGLKARIGELGG